MISTSAARRKYARPCHGRAALAKPRERLRPLDGRLRASLLAVAACGVALILGALFILGLPAARSVGVGAAIATVNLWALARIVTALLVVEERTRGAGAWAFLGSLKMVGLFALVWLLMRSHAVSPLAMLVGFGALPMGIAIGALVSDRSGPIED
jgi:ATP synthase I chain